MKTKKGKLGNTPLMTDEEIKCIESYLKPSHTMLEWGSGGSTLHFSKFVKKYISIESDSKWFKKVKYQIKKHKLKNIEYYIETPVNITIIIKDTEHQNIDNSLHRLIKSHEAMSGCYINYINKIDKIGNPTYDIILIDGKARLQCAIKAMEYMNESSLLFIHDYYMDQKLHNLEEYYEIIESVGKHEYYKSLYSLEEESNYIRRNTLVVMKKRK